MFRSFAVLILILLPLFFLACSTPRAALQGDFSTTITGPEIPEGLPAEAFIGRWQLRLGPADRFSVQQNGEPMAEGIYRYAQNNLILTDETGRRACLMSGESTGTYLVTYDGSSLVLSTVEDRCTGRKFVLTVHPLIRK